MGCLTQEMLEHNLIDPTELMQVVSKLHTHYFNAVNVVIMAFSPVSFLCLSGGLLHGGVSLPSASRAKREIHLQHHSVPYLSEIQWKVCSQKINSAVFKKKTNNSIFFHFTTLKDIFMFSVTASDDLEVWPWDRCLYYTDGQYFQKENSAV